MLLPVLDFWDYNSALESKLKSNEYHHLVEAENMLPEDLDYEKQIVKSTVYSWHSAKIRI